MRSVPSIRSFAVMLASCVLLAAVNASAADAPATSATPTKETREKMALAHEKMAMCLRSDRVVTDCRQEMMQTCQQMGNQGCGIMSPTMMGKRHMNQTAPTSK